MTLRGLHVASHILSRLPTVGVFAKATPQDTPKAVFTKTDEPMRRFVLKQLSFSSKKRTYQSTCSVSEEKAGGVQPAGGSQPELKVSLAMINDYLEINLTSLKSLIAMMMTYCAQEGEDYGKGVIFYLRENKVTIGTIIVKINY